MSQYFQPDLNWKEIVQVLYDMKLTGSDCINCQIACLDSKPIGGPGHIIEIDESKFGKRKFHRGKRVDGVWVFGSIDRETKEFFFNQLVTDQPRHLFQ